MNTRTRTIDHTGELTWKEHRDSVPGGIAYGTSRGVTSTQRTTSESHEWPVKDTRRDSGGDFTTSSYWYKNHTPGIFRSPESYGFSYEGPAWPFNPRSAMLEVENLVMPSSDAVLRQLGSTAISRCLPTNPVADAGTFIGELKSGLPKMVGSSIFKSKFKDYRKIGDEYLNVEFGWKPLISDLQAFGKAAQESDKILKQLHRDSGRVVRRKYSFPDDVVTTQGGSFTGRRCWTPNGLAYHVNTYDGTGILSTRTTVTTKTWFSGAFTYHLNLGTRLQDKMDRAAAEARKLYGVELTPATVWNLAPWSWIVDWEGNIGDVLHNVSRFSQDGLVLRYGYIMQQKTAKVDYTLGSNGRVLGSPDTNLTLSIVAQSKIRRRATPFGFGFDMTALTGRQSAILGALGISRGPRHG